MQYFLFYQSTEDADNGLSGQIATTDLTNKPDTEAVTTHDLHVVVNSATENPHKPKIYQVSWSMFGLAAIIGIEI